MESFSGETIMTKEHTPTPWFIDEYKSVVDEKGQTISANGFSLVMSYGDNQKFARANAAHIVKCVNMHDELVEALKKCGMLLEHGGFDLEFIDSALKKAGAL